MVSSRVLDLSFQVEQKWKPSLSSPGPRWGSGCRAPPASPARPGQASGHPRGPSQFSPWGVPPCVCSEPAVKLVALLVADAATWEGGPDSDPVPLSTCHFGAACPCGVTAFRGHSCPLAMLLPSSDFHCVLPALSQSWFRALRASPFWVLVSLSYYFRKRSL